MIIDKAIDKITGKLEKMIIKSYPTIKEAESGNAPVTKSINVLINPENYKLNYKIRTDCSGKKQGSSGEETKFHGIENTSLTFDFHFDDTGIIDGEFKDILKGPNRGVFDNVKEFREHLMQYNGDVHQTPIIKLAWVPCCL